MEDIKSDIEYIESDVEDIKSEIEDTDFLNEGTTELLSDEEVVEKKSEGARVWGSGSLGVKKRKDSKEVIVLDDLGTLNEEFGVTDNLENKEEEDTVYRV